ncbi:hypothetical protein MRB53_040831 [Persea americana]|nr:hypothetical protein MRB53_040831 [Persea americana]
MKEDPNNSLFQIRDLDIEFPVGELSVISGPTGSGKTSTLMALLGEMTVVKGHAYLPGARNREDSQILPGSELIDSVAFCAQSAWLLNDTIRNNILFSNEYDSSRYEQVIKACALTRDFEILEHGDGTEIGEKGITLSGGQKQRVSLARALYSKAKHLLLDDCLSAVDSHTAKWIFDHALTGNLVEDRTRILVTHNLVEQGAFGKGEEALKSAISAINSAANSRAPSRIPSRNQISGIVEEQEGTVKAEALAVKKTEDREGQESSSGGRGSKSARLGWLEGLRRIYKITRRSSLLGNACAGVPITAKAFDILQTYWIREWALSYRRGPQSLRLYSTTHPPSTSETHCAPQHNPSSTLPIPALVLQNLKSSPDLNYYLGVYALIAFFFCLTTFAAYSYLHARKHSRLESTASTSTRKGRALENAIL